MHMSFWLRNAVTTLFYSEGRIRDCKDVLDRDNNSRNGLHRIDIGQTKDYVVCDMTTSGGGWTVRVQSNARFTIFLLVADTNYIISKMIS